MRRGGWAGFWAAGYDAACMGILAFSMGMWGGPLLAFFDDTPRVVAIGREYLAAVGPSYITYGAAIVVGNAFSGIGATRKTLRLDLAIVLLIQVPLCLIAVLFRGSRDALWSAIATAVSALAVSLFLPMRVSEDDERQGLDIASHGERGWEFD
jgi:Na+-driven multidrug efflux pump